LQQTSAARLPSSERLSPAVRSQRKEGPYDEHLQARAAGQEAGRAADNRDHRALVSPGDRIPIAAGRTLQVVRRYHDDADDLPVLVVEDVVHFVVLAVCTT
jgi:hypothetical protein